MGHQTGHQSGHQAPVQVIENKEVLKIARPKRAIKRQVQIRKN
jgi:hypothetical protein